MTVRIVIADDHKIFRQGLISLLQTEVQIEVIGEADNGRVAVELAESLRPDLVIMDVGMPELNGIEATRRIVKSLPETRVIGLSMHSDPHFVTAMFEAGAAGYILKECAYEELTSAISSVQADRPYLSPAIAGLVVEGQLAQPAHVTVSTRPPLSPRETEVLQLLAEGKATKEVAGILGVSVKTIETHRKQIMDKLGMRSIAELTKYAIRQGLTSVEQ